ncbi:hemolysin D [Bacteroidia bacterium]|nr:hemolysin D [Bacteroidia bacterium]
MKTNYIVIMSLFFLGFISCGKNQKAENSEEASEHEHSEAIALTDKQMQAVDIRIGFIEQRDLNSVVRANGEMVLDPQKKADVNSLVGGIIQQILVTEGKNVGKGQVVAYLENTGIVELQKDYLTAKKEAQMSGQEYNRQKDLFDQGAGIEKTFQQATANYEIAQARLTGLEKQLQQLSLSPEQVSEGNIVTQIPIKAPIAGTVNKINVSLGSYIDIQTPVMSISDNSQIHCDLKVFEKDIHFIRPGQEVDMQLTNQPGISLKGTVYEFNKFFETDTKAIVVHATVQNKNDLKLIPGMYVTALINIGKQKTPAVPNDAIVSMEGKKYLFLLEDEETTESEKSFHFKPVEIITGISELGFTQITLLVGAKNVSPLPDEAPIVISNAFYIASMLAGGEEEE